MASRLLSHQGLYIFGPLDRVHPVILEDAWGKVAFVPLPYAEPARVRVMMNQKGLSGAEDIHSYEEAEKKLSDILLSALPDPSMRKVALAHVFAAGGTPSESERPLSIGGYDRISDSVFDAYDYAALGHLHRHQRTQMQSERVQYSGSLMRYSFDEAEQHKGVIVGTIGEDGSVETDFRELSPLHQVRVLEGTFAELMSEKREASEDYLQVILTDELPVIDAMPKLREKYKNALGVEQNMGYKEDSGRRDIELEHMSDQDIFRAFVSEFRERELSDKEEALANVCWEAVYKKEEER